MTKSANKPVATLRDGAIKATIWKNKGENGSFFSVNFSRTYSDNDGKNPQDTDSFSGSQIPQLGLLVTRAYNCIAVLRDKEKQDEAA